MNDAVTNTSDEREQQLLTRYPKMHETPDPVEALLVALFYLDARKRNLEEQEPLSTLQEHVINAVHVKDLAKGWSNVEGATQNFYKKESWTQQPVPKDARWNSDWQHDQESRFLSSAISQVNNMDRLQVHELALQVASHNIEIPEGFRENFGLEQAKSAVLECLENSTLKHLGTHEYQVGHAVYDYAISNNSANTAYQSETIQIINEILGEHLKSPITAEEVQDGSNKAAIVMRISDAITEKYAGSSDEYGDFLREFRSSPKLPNDHILRKDPIWRIPPNVRERLTVMSEYPPRRLPDNEEIALSKEPKVEAITAERGIEPTVPMPAERSEAPLVSPADERTVAPRIPEPGNVESKPLETTSPQPNTSEKEPSDFVVNAVAKYIDYEEPVKRDILLSCFTDHHNHPSLNDVVRHVLELEPDLKRAVMTKLDISPPPSDARAMLLLKDLPEMEGFLRRIQRAEPVVVLKPSSTVDQPVAERMIEAERGHGAG